MKIVFNYNNSDFPYPSPAPLFQPSLSNSKGHLPQCRGDGRREWGTFPEPRRAAIRSRRVCLLRGGSTDYQLLTLSACCKFATSKVRNSLVFNVGVLEALIWLICGK